MAIVSDSLEASGVINNINGFIEPDQIPAANAAIYNNNVVHHDHYDDDNNGDKKQELEKKKKKKKAGPFSFFRVALVALRSDNKKKPSLRKATSVVDMNDANWKKIVGSMRPLHLQDDKSPAPSPGRGTWDDLVYNHSHPPSSPSSSSVSTLSQYASASNLQALDDVGDEDEDPDVVFDAIRGDEMIDYKAEEFIAQFYQQMQMDKYPHHHRGKSQPFWSLASANR